MPIKERQQRWSPDTCNCSILQDWVDEYDDKGEHTKSTHVKSFIEKDCGSHGPFRGHDKHHEIVADENRHKNVVVNAVAKEMGVQAIDLPYRWNQRREIVVDLGGVSALRKDIVRNVIKDAAGDRKVNFE